MKARRRGRSLNPTEDPRKKKKKSKSQSYTKIILEEIRDFFLLLGGLILVFIVGSVIQIYFYNQEETGGFYPVNGPVIEPCKNCTYERVGPLEVLVSGNRDGDMLIFLHGFPETAWLAWHNQIEYFSNLGYFVVAPDQRGYNNSAKLSSIMDYHLDYLSQDIIDIIDHYNYERAYVVGHDWGAAVAWHLGQHHADRVDKMVIINVPHPKVMQYELLTSYEQISNSWYIFFFQLPFIPEAKISRNDYQWLTGAFTMSPRGTYSKATIESYKEAWSIEGVANGMVNWYRAAILGSIFRPSSPKRVENLPTLMIWGDQDRALKTAMAKPSIDLCDDGKLVILEGVSHWVPHEVPDKVNSLISDFLI